MDPQEIQTVEFTTTRFKGGYDPAEVDNFIDRVAEELQLATNRANSNGEVAARLRTELAEANRKLAGYSDLPTTQIPMQATGILEAAQRVADQVQVEARQAADKVAAEAVTAADSKLAEATKEADQRRQAAEAACYAVESRLKDLHVKHDQLRAFLKSHLTSSLDALEVHPNG
ncbi:DivIVA domain-containing protein [Streptomyces sp. NPDC055085]